MTYAILTLIGILMIVFASQRFAGSITGPVQRLKEHADELAKGNLRMDDLVVESDDEIGALTEAFNTMSRNLRGLIQKMTTTAEQVAASSEELTASSQQSAEAANNVATTITQVADGMSSQSQHIDGAKQNMDNVSQDIKASAGKTKQVADSALKTSAAAKKGEQLMVEAMSTIRLRLFLTRRPFWR
jgi:methyl-accepting chemotaxis protein